MFSKRKRIISEQELGRILERILKEAQTQANYNGEEFIGVTLEQIAEKVNERIGNKWDVK